MQKGHPQKLRSFHRRSRSSTATALAERARTLGAIEHILIDCKQDFFDTVIRHLIAGNVLRGQAYPLCVGAERGLQAERLAKLAAERGATTVAHGCTALHTNDHGHHKLNGRPEVGGLRIEKPQTDEPALPL